MFKVNGSFGVRLQYALNLRGVKQKELAKLTGVTEVTISRYINNIRTPDIEFVKCAARELNVDISFLMGVGESIIAVNNRQSRKHKNAKYKVIRQKDNKALFITDNGEIEALDKLFSLNEDLLVGE